MYRGLRHGVSPGVADSLHLHLICQRIASRVLDDDAARAMLVRNNWASPCLLGG